MSRQPGLFLLLFGLVALGAFLFFAKGDGESHGASAARPEPSTVEIAVDRATDEQSAPRVPAMETHSLTGRVILPEGTPADEALLVEVHAFDFYRKLPATAAGEFTVELPEHAEDGTLELRGRYLFLDEPVPFDLTRDEPIELRPELGARLVVEPVFPAGHGPASWAGMRPSVRLVRKYAMGFKGLGPSVDAEGKAEFDALSAGHPWVLEIRGKGLQEYREGSLPLEPGQTLTLRPGLVGS